MKNIRTLLSLAAFLTLALAACASSPAPGTPPAGNPPSSDLPPPPTSLQVSAVQRLSVASDNRFPPADFGKAIALGEGVLAVGAPSVTGGPDFSAPGSVYTYRKQAESWTLESRLAASDQEDGFQYAQAFGSSLALQADLLFVGAPQADDLQAGDNTGAVYIFQYQEGGWEEISILKASQPEPDAHFGSELAVHGNHLGVLEGHPSRGGRLYLFHNEDGEWPEVAMVEAPQSKLPGRAGVASFDLFGDTLSVSLMSYQGEGAEMQVSGSIRFYKFNGETWVENGSLPGGLTGVVALEGEGSSATRLAIATQASTGAAFQPGAVLIFRQEGEDWMQEETLVSVDMESFPGWGSSFGGDVDLQNNLLLIGGPGYSEDAFWDGVAYLYQLHEWYWFDQLRLIPPEDGELGDFFGAEVAVVQNTLLISAPNEFGNAVYVYEVGARDENRP